MPPRTAPRPANPNPEPHAPVGLTRSSRAFSAALLGAALLPLAAASTLRAAEEDDRPILDAEEARVSAWAVSPGVRGSVWGGDAELGYLATEGNADTRSLQARGRIENDRENWRHTGRIDFLFAKDETGRSTDAYQAVQKSAFKLSAVDYLFEQLKYARDRSQGYLRQTVEVIGYGWRLVAAETASLDLEAGPGARQTWPRAGGYRSEAIGVLIGELNWDLTAEVNFNEYVTVESGESNTFLGSISALTMSLAGSFSLRATYEIKHNTEVPDGDRHTDTITSVTLVYKF